MNVILTGKEKDMDCKDLMIGDWVKVDQTTETVNAKVLGVYKDGINYEVDYSGVRATNQIHTDYVSPIELTEDILVKNGFVKTWNGDWQLKEYATIIISKDYYVKIFERSIRIYYVHELQHMLYAACVNKELVID